MLQAVKVKIFPYSFPDPCRAVAEILAFIYMLNMKAKVVTQGYFCKVFNSMKILFKSETVLNETVKKVPLRRLGKPDEVADGVIAVIENDFFNGKIFEIDGGLVICYMRYLFG